MKSVHRSQSRRPDGRRGGNDPIVHPDEINRAQKTIRFALDRAVFHSGGDAHDLYTRDRTRHMDRPLFEKCFENGSLGLFEHELEYRR